MTTTLRPERVGLIVLPILLALSTLASITTTAAQETEATPSASPATTMTADEALAAVTRMDGVLRFDVAENATRFVFAPAPVHDDGLPAHGNSFVTQGYLYPAGTLTDSNGVLADGSPEFPDQVLGEWTCRGWFVGDGAHTTTGAWVVTTQIYNFGSTQGPATLVSDGYEIADVGAAVARAVTGGTGPFATAGGEARQVLLGFNASAGVNLTFEIDVES